MRPINGDDVTKAVAGSTAALRAAVDRDWKAVRAGRLEWDCHATAVHVADDLIAYAGNLAGRAQDAYVPFELSFLDEGTGNAGLLHVIETTGALLAAAVRTAPPGVRAFHPYPFRSADAEGFAAMGIAEVLLHTHDMAEGLGIPYEPPAELVASVLACLFPHVQPGPAPWPTLLWATGRGELPGRAPVTEWRWNNNLVIPAERVALTGVRPAAAHDLRLGGDGGFTWLDGGPYEGTRVASGFLVKAYEAGRHRPEFGVFALVRHEDGRAVGGIGFHGAPDEHGWVEVGYDLVEGARGQGYATEALRTLTDWALARDDVQMVFATIEHANVPSQHVASRAGFTRATVEEERVARDEHGMDEGLQLYIRRV
ncbi:acetyltransferase (GNAT) family protein [Streptomyces puniciscabiei]|uniref:Acetyltransferase (GNAT) family protein n=1 Tax=Streptomyces puniciscabiei TaxID=164348 RepID=A0A542UGJ8_9ACTN|nr:GNAT family N-acetyltransferase [Streptomyces puniciscabiei]TQK98210.1 acetyltransferase (GNAT) family protein [Streptomyces puniciscabiei]